jgi:hypothetical protein
MIPLQDKQNTVPPSGDYPYGELKDKNGAIAGTPANVALFNDIMQFAERLMDLGDVTPNGLPDNEYSGFQLIEALLNLTVRRKVVEIGAWDMDATASVFIAHGLDLGGAGTTVANIRGVRCVIINDAETASYEFDIWNGTVPGGTIAVTPSVVQLSRTALGFFDSTTFNDAAINRGYVIIEYTE